MSKKEALHQLYAQCQKINFDESYDIIASASDPDEANFFRTVTDLILKQKQKKVIEANRFQMKRYILFAGCNGVGKSTLYQTNDLFRNMPRVNMDEIVREFGSQKNESDAFKAGKIAVGKISSYFREALSFNQEVTLCGQSIWKNIEKAHELGYQVEMYYVGEASVEIAKERVALRVKKGGHGIPDKDIERRFVESIENLPRAIRVCDIVEIYDNTNSFERVARYEQGKCLLRTVTNLSWVP